MHIFFALIIPLLCLLPTALGITALSSSVETVTIALFVFGIVCTALLCFSLYKVKALEQFYTWIVLDESRILVKTLFKKSYCLEYGKCAQIGIGGYIHHVYTVGTSVKFIYFSYDKIAENLKTRLNTVHPTKRFVKVAYSDKLYNYLMDILPQKQTAELERTKQKYINE